MGEGKRIWIERFKLGHSAPFYVTCDHTEQWQTSYFMEIHADKKILDFTQTLPFALFNKKKVEILYQANKYQLGVRFRLA